MTRPVNTAELIVQAADSTAPVGDFVIPGTDINHVSWSERAGKPLDTGKVILNNEDGKYTIDNPVDVGDKLIFRVSFEGEGGGFAFGEGPFGQGTFTGGPARELGTLAVSDWHASGWSWNSTLELDVETFVFHRLNAEEVRISEKGTQLSGSEGAVLNQALTDFVPRVKTDLLPEITETIDYFSDGKKANVVVDELAIRARVATGDAYVTGARGESLLFQSLAELDSIGTLTSGTESPDLKGTPSQSASTDDIVNEMRVEGGIDDIGNIDESQTTEDTWTTVTNTTRVTYQLTPSKPEITQVDVKIQDIEASDDDLRIRLHPDEAGSPRDLADTDLDYANARFEVTDGFEGEITVLLGEHTLGPDDNPWLVFQGTGSDGVNVRTDSATGDPWFRTHFAKPIIVEIPDTVSQDSHGAYRDTLKNDNIRSFNAARDRAEAELKRRSLPRLKFGPMTAESTRAHDLNVGDKVTLPFPWLRADGDYLCTQVSHTFEKSTLETNVEFMGFERYA